MKERRRPGASKILLYLGLVFVLVVVGGLIWFSSWVTGYLHSEAFRQLAAEVTGDALHARVNYGPFHWTRDSVFVDDFDAAGSENSPLESLGASELRADVNWRSLLGGVWRIERIEMLQLNASFVPIAAGKLPSPPSVMSPAPSGIAALLPRKFEIGEVVVENANLKFSFLPGKELLSAVNVRLLAGSDPGGWVFSGGGGTLTAPLIGETGITDYHARLQGNDLFITGSHFTVGSSGKVSLAGQVGADTKFHLTWSRVDVSQLLPPAWMNRLSGGFGGSCTMQPAGGDRWNASGQFKLTEGLLQNFPLLDRLAAFSGSPQFSRLPVDEISGKFERSQTSLVVTGFLLESKGFLRVESDRVVSDGTISGTFRVGVGSSALRWLPAATDRVFTAERGGYLWTEVKLEGTASDPHEDLSARLIAATKAAAIQKGSDFLNAADAVPESARRGFSSLLNTLLPAANPAPAEDTGRQLKKP